MLELWNQIINELRLKAPNTFDRWFSSIQFDGVTDGILQLRAQNAFVRDFVEDHYVPVIQEKLREHTGLTIRVTWIIDNDLNSPVSTRPSDPVRPSVPPSVTQAPEHPTVELVASELGSHMLQEAPVEIKTVHGLNEKYTFANFIVGPSNELAHAAALAAAGAGSVRRYNPLFICGGTGLGKTHLLHAVGHHVRTTRGSCRILVVSAEAFTNEFISSLAAKDMDAFRTRYRTQCDLLLMDDVHHLAGKVQTQEEFFHTFNTLHGTDKQIVLTSDRYPHELEGMTERLVSRFTWGLVADVQAPQLETRVAILRKKAQSEQIILEDEAALFIAQAFRSNVRELEGALIRLAAQASIYNAHRIDLAYAQNALASTLPSRTTPTSVDDVIRAVCHHFNLRSSDLLGKDRHKLIAQARHVAIYLCRQRLKCSYPELGRHFGHRDHTSVMHAVRKVEAMKGEDPSLRGHIDAIERKLG